MSAPDRTIFSVVLGADLLFFARTQIENAWGRPAAEWARKGKHRRTRFLSHRRNSSGAKFCAVQCTQGAAGFSFLEQGGPSDAVHASQAVHPTAQDEDRWIVRSRQCKKFQNLDLFDLPFGLSFKFYLTTHHNTHITTALCSRNKEKWRLGSAI